MKAERVLAIGVFDLFHVGHLRYLQFVSTRGSRLVVAVTLDHMAARVKGRQPLIPQEQRLEIVRGFGFVAEAELAPTSTEMTAAAADWIEAWNIQHVVSGGSWQGSKRWARLEPELLKRGISVEYAPHTDGVSTTGIIEKALQKFSTPEHPC